MIIDSKGKLFGKVSIIDILILLVLIAGIAGVWAKFFKSGSVTPLASKNETYIVGLYWEESPDFAVNAVKIGDIARDFDRGAILGKVTDIKIDDSISFVETNDGRVIAGSTPGYVSYHITLEATGVSSDVGGAIFDGMDYQIGKSMTVKVGNAIFMGRIDRLEKKG